MKDCLICGEPAIWEQPVAIAITKTMALCPIHFQTLMVTQGFVHGGVSLDCAGIAGKDLESLARVQHLGMWDRKIAAEVNLASTLNDIHKATKPSDIINGGK